MMELDSSIKAKFDAVLAEVKEPQSELTLAELGIVKKFSYHAPERTIVVHLHFKTPSYECPACFAANEFVINGIERNLKTALEAQFDGWEIRFASAE